MPSKTKIKSENKSQALDSVNRRNGIVKNSKTFFPTMGRLPFVVVLTLMVVTAACAYDSVDQGFEWRTKNSTDIVVGQVVRTTDDICAYESRCAEVKVLSSLKGKGTENILVLFDGSISDLNPACCAKGATYLFYLKKIKKGTDAQYFESVDGVFGIYRLDDRFKSGRR